MQVTRTPADVLATRSRRYQEKYGDRAVEIYTVPEDPYEPRSEEKEEYMGGIDVVIAFRESHDLFEDTDDVTRIAHDVMDEMGWELYIAPHHVSEKSRRAGWAEEEGTEI